MEAVESLQSRKRRFEPSTLEELVNPVQEKEVGETEQAFDGDDDEIVAQVQYNAAVARGEVMEIDEDEDEEKDDEPVDRAYAMLQLVRVSIHQIPGQSFVHSATATLPRHLTERADC